MSITCAALLRPRDRRRQGRSVDRRRRGLDADQLFRVQRRCRSVRRSDEHDRQKGRSTSLVRRERLAWPLGKYSGWATAIYRVTSAEHVERRDRRDRPSHRKDRKLFPDLKPRDRKVPFTDKVDLAKAGVGGAPLKFTVGDGTLKMDVSCRFDSADSNFAIRGDKLYKFTHLFV